MKKTYETPSVEVVKFQYRDQVVAASGCISYGDWSHDKGVCTNQDSDSNHTN